MRIRVHAATVEEVVDFEGDRAFRAVCLETGAVCDAWGFVEPEGARAILEPGEGAAIHRALDYLHDASLHEWDSPRACLDALHVMAHDLDMPRSASTSTDGGTAGETRAKETT